MPETDTQSSFMIPSGVLVVRYYLPKSYILPLDKRHFISVTFFVLISQCREILTPPLNKGVVSVAAGESGDLRGEHGLAAGFEGAVAKR